MSEKLTPLTTPKDLEFQWALPEALELPTDQLEVRLDLYHETALMYVIEQGVITTRVVSGADIAAALIRAIPFSSGLLPEGALWYQYKGTARIALWRPPKVWRVALQLDIALPPKRFRLPMPGLVFVCSPGHSPWVYAAKARPVTIDDVLFAAPLLNVFASGLSCPGTHKYPGIIEEIPESFFASFFSHAGDGRNRSQKHPSDLLALWEELDGKRRYPLSDLVPIGTVKQIMEGAR